MEVAEEKGSEKYDKYWAEVFSKQLGIQMLEQLTGECLELEREGF